MKLKTSNKFNQSVKCMLVNIFIHTLSLFAVTVSITFSNSQLNDEALK